LEECGERVYRLVQLGVFLDAYPKIYMLVSIGSNLSQSVRVVASDGAAAWWDGLMPRVAIIGE
jgi:hypothetical protein